MSLPRPQIEAARKAVRDGRATSVSAYVSDALAQRQREESLADLAAAWVAEDGKPSDEAYAWADAALDDGDQRPADR